MSAIQRIIKSSRGLVRAPDGCVYEVRRIQAGALAEHKATEVLGLWEAKQAAAEIRAEQEAAIEEARRAGMDASKQAAAEAKRARQKAHNERLVEETIARTLKRNPGLLGAYERRVDAYVCAGVVAIAAVELESDAEVEQLDAERTAIAEAVRARVADGEEVAEDDPQLDEFRAIAARLETLEAERSAVRFCPADAPRPGAVPVQLEPVRFVMDEAEEDHGASPPRLWVAHLPEVTRAFLHEEIERRSATASIRPFRGVPGAVSTARPDRPSVQSEALGAAQVGPNGPGDRRGGDGAGDGDDR